MPITREQYEGIISELDAGQIPEEHLPQVGRLLQEYEEAGGIKPAGAEGEDPSLLGQVGEEAQYWGGRLAGETAGWAGGAGRAAYKMSKSLYDLGAWTTSGFGYAENPVSRKLEEYAQTSQAGVDAMEDATLRLAQDVTSAVVGEPVPPEAVEAMVDASMDYGELASELGISIGGGAMALGAKTVKGLAAAATAEGGMWGWLFSDSEKAKLDERVADRLGEAEVGAIMGAGFSTVPAAFLGARNAVAKWFDPIRRDSRYAKDLAEEFGGTLTYAMASQSPEMALIEAQAAGSVAQKRLREAGPWLAESLGEKVGVRLRPLTEIGEDTGATMKQLFDEAQWSIRASKAAKNKQWAADMKDARRIGGNLPVLKNKDLSDLYTLKDSIGEDITKTAMHDIPISDSMKTIVHQMERAKQRGGATVDELDNWWRKFNDWKGDPKGGILKASREAERYSGQQQVWAGKLASELKRMVADATDAAIPGSVEAAALNRIASARENYSAWGRKIAEKETAVTDILGTEVLDPVKFLNRLGNTHDTETIRRAVKVLDDVDGGGILKQRMKEAAYEGMIIEAMTPMRAAPQAAGNISIKALAESWSKHSQKPMLAGLLTAEQNKMAKKGMELMRYVLAGTTYFPDQVVRKTTLGLDLQALAINAISRDPGFVGRTAAGAAVRGKGADWLLQSKEGHKILEALHPDKAIKPQKWAGARNAAIVGLLEMQKASVVDEVLAGDK